MNEKQCIHFVLHTYTVLTVPIGGFVQDQLAVIYFSIGVSLCINTIFYYENGQREILDEAMDWKEVGLFSFENPD